MPEMPPASSAAASCSTIFSNQYSSPHQRDEGKAEPLNGVREMRAVVEGGGRPAPWQAARGWWIGTLELNHDWQEPHHTHIAAPAGRNERDTAHRSGIGLAVQRVIDVKCVGRGYPTAIDE